jgi:hypothetical protein
MPDFAALLASDPGLIQMNADLAAQGIASAGQRTAATQRAVTQFGLAPQDFSANELSLISPTYGQDITPDVLSAARGNTFSTQARLTKAHTDAIQSIRGALAARGLLHSGELGYQLGNEQRGFETGEYDARNKLLDYLSGVQGSYAQGEQQRQAAAAAAAGQAMQNQLALWLAQMQYGGTGGDTNPAPPQAPGPTVDQAPVATAGYQPRTLTDALNAALAGHRSGV